MPPVPAPPPARGGVGEPPAAPGGGRGGAPAGPIDGSAAWSAILDEQLGLRLQPEKVPVEIIVIDQLEKPTSN